MCSRRSQDTTALAEIQERNAQEMARLRETVRQHQEGEQPARLSGAGGSDKPKSPDKHLDFSFIRERVPIRDVCRLLGIQVMSDGRMARCWRTEAHQHGDRTPSMGFWLRRNKVRCFVCDEHALSPLDLVIAFHGCALVEAASWIANRFAVPKIERGRHITGRRRWSPACRVGVGGAKFDQLEWVVKTGFFAELTQPQQSILVTLLSFADPDTDVAEVSYRGITRFSGVRSFSNVSEAIRLFERIGLLRVDRNSSDCGYRNCNRYHLQFGNERFLSLANRIYRQQQEEIEVERRLREKERNLRRRSKRQPVSPVHHL